MTWPRSAAVTSTALPELRVFTLGIVIVPALRGKGARRTVAGKPTPLNQTGANSQEVSATIMGRILETPFTQLLGCRVPLQLAGMAQVSGPQLAAAVAEPADSGWWCPRRDTAGMLDRLARQTSGEFGVNFLMPFLDLKAVEAAASCARVVEFFYAAPDPGLIGRVHHGGALAAWQVGSSEEGRAAVDAGCDFVVAQGVEAGGHIRGTLALLVLLGEVLDRIDVPVVAAGGIATGRAMAAALAAGASGVRVGTRFVASTESGSSSPVRRGAHPGALDRDRPDDDLLSGLARRAASNSEFVC